MTFLSLYSARNRTKFPSQFFAMNEFIQMEVLPPSIVFPETLYRFSYYLSYFSERQSDF